MDDEGKWDKDRQHLDDHEHDLLHEEALLNCEHEDYKITDIVNLRTHGLQYEKLNNPMLELEIVCEFCGKSNMGVIPLSALYDLVLPYYDEEWE